MAESNLPASLLDHAGKVFSLAGRLGQGFYEDHQDQSERGVVDPAGWDRHSRSFEGYCDALLNLRDAVQNPPDWFAPVANELLEASRVAKEIRDVMERPNGRIWAAYREFFPALNAVCQNGWRAVLQVRRSRRLDDPFAFADAKGSDQTVTTYPQPSVVELLGRVIRRLQAKPDLLRAAVWNHPDALNASGLNDAARRLGLGPILSIGEAPDWARAPNLPADHPANTHKVECLTVHHPDGSEYRIRRSGGLLDDSTDLPVTETIARLNAWIRRAQAVVECVDFERRVVDVATVGDVWKAFAEGKQPAPRASAITISPGVNVAQITCPSPVDEAKRLALDRVLAAVTVEGGAKEVAMERLIARMQLQTGKDKTSIINMPLTEFAELLREPTRPGIQMHDAVTEKRPRTPKLRGPQKKADDETIQREAQVAADWQRARESGVYKPDFAKQVGMTVKELDRLLDRVGVRKRRSDK